MLLFNPEAVKMNLEEVRMNSKSRARLSDGRGFFVETKGV